MKQDFSPRGVCELVDAICNCGLDVPDGLPEEIVKRGKEAVPLLCEIVASEDWWAETEAPRSWAVIHAMHLLGGIGDPSAADALLEPMRRDEDSDFLCDGMMAIIARLGPGAFEPATEFVRDPSHSYVYRWVIYQGLVGTAKLFPEVAERVIVLGREIVTRALTAGTEQCPEGIACLLAGFQREEDRPLLKRLQDEHAIDGYEIYGPEGIDEAFIKGHDEHDLACATADPMAHFSKARLAQLKDVQEEDGSSLTSSEDEGWDEEGWDGEDDDPDWADDLSPTDTIHATRIGRNDPCPCGSGRKYKKCCGKL